MPTQAEPCAVRTTATCQGAQAAMMDAVEGLDVGEALLALGFASGDDFALWADSATPVQLTNVGTALAMLITN